MKTSNGLTKRRPFWVARAHHCCARLFHFFEAVPALTKIWIGWRPALAFGRIGLTLAMLYFGPNGHVFEKWSGFDLFVGAAALLLNGLFIKQTLVTARRLDLMERPQE